ncbi:MAG: ABC transporter substrate-binding protein, partial [Nevskiales bacterium]
AHYDYNPDKARQLLAEAGYPGGFNTSMSFYRPAPDRMVAEAIQGYLRAVGIRSDLNATTLKAIYEDVAQGKVPIMLQSHGQYNINDVSIFLPLYYGGEPADPYRDPRILDWLHQASQTGDNDKRKALYLQTEQRIMEQAFGVPLFVQAVNYAFNKDLVFTPGPDEDPRLFLARWK